MGRRGAGGRGRVGVALGLAMLPWGMGPSPSPGGGGPRVDVQAAGAVKEKEKEGEPRPKKPDVIFYPTPKEVVDRMLEMAEIKKGDVLYDLGCGDGRIVVAAAKKYGIRAVGFDIDPQRVKEARENVEASGVSDLVTIRQADIFETDLREASVVSLYLLPELNVRLMPQLRKLRDGSRIVSHDFDMKGAKPRKVVTLTTPDEEEEHSIYLWVVPWEPERP
jgi:SAM-dependent methyltransferase